MPVSPVPGSQKKKQETVYSSEGAGLNTKAQDIRTKKTKKKDLLKLN